MYIPTTPEEFTPEWLTEALRGRGALADGEVVGVEAEPLEGGIGAAAYRFSLTYSGGAKDGPASVIAKFRNVDQGAHERLTAIGVNLREVRFYQVQAPEVPLRSGHYYHADFDDETGNFVVLMEDLGHLTALSQGEGTTPENVDLGLASIAPMHAKFWNSPALAEWDWLAGSSPQMRFPAQTFAVYERFATNVLVNHREALTEPVAVMGDRLLSGKFDAVWERLEGPPWTLCHGDYRLGNYFMDGDEVVAFDWGSVGRFRSTVDVSYLIGMSLSVEGRRSSEMGLLRRYHDRLTEGGVTDYSFDDLLLDYRWGYFRLLMTGTVALAALERRPQIESTVMEIVGRLQALADWDCGELLD